MVRVVGDDDPDRASRGRLARPFDIATGTGCPSPPPTACIAIRRCAPIHHHPCLPIGWLGQGVEEAKRPHDGPVAPLKPGDIYRLPPACYVPYSN